jgi:hypothetical protein
MNVINVDGLPEPVVRSLEALVHSFKQEVATTAESSEATSLESLKRAAGSWADADEIEFKRWLQETYLARKIHRHC